MRRRIANLLNTANSLRQATGILVITALASNVLGLVRNTVVARNIPLAAQDDFWTAFVIPDTVFNVLIFGAIGAAFIPLFRGLLVTDKKDDAWELAGSFLARMSLLIVSLAILLFIFMPAVVHLLFAKVTGADSVLVISLSRILLIQTILMGWSYIVGGILNAKKRFLAYSLSPLFYNMAIIVGAFIAPRFGGDQAITVLIWSVVVGALLHLLIQIPSLLAVGWRFRYLNFRPNEYFREIVTLMTPRSIALGITSINAVVFTAIARNLLAPGSLSIYRLVEAFQTAPIAIFANAIAVAFFPTLTEHASKENWTEFGAALERGLRFTLFTLIPSTVIFIVLRAQIIRLYIGLGPNISWPETISAIQAFGWFSIGIVPAGLVSIFARGFYAVKNTILPMLIAIFTLIFGAITAYALSLATTFGASALTIASSAASLVQFIALYIAYVRLVRRPLPERAIVITGLKTAGVSFAMGLAMWLTLQAVHILYTETAITSTRFVTGLFGQTLLAAIVGLSIFWLFARLWLREESDWLLTFRRK